jgi:hypothetical protein
MSSTYGFGAAGTGDVDGDGFADVVIGADNIPSVFFYRGAAGGLSTTASATLGGPAHSYFGETVAANSTPSVGFRLLARL